MDLDRYRQIRKNIERLSYHSAHITRNRAGGWYIMERVHDLGGTDYYHVENLNPDEVITLVTNDIFPVWFSAKEDYDRLVEENASENSDTKS